MEDTKIGKLNFYKDSHPVFTFYLSDIFKPKPKKNRFEFIKIGKIQNFTVKILQKFGFFWPFSFLRNFTGIPINLLFFTFAILHSILEFNKFGMRLVGWGGTWKMMTIRTATL
ncbi:hypothetical protein BpHYR1_026343 [Brachionus plicatilis]|uniref:Uncharacterized protein n=1 Tax=Brachionus plicatilis TaxID=10195 RepID=A0A3M7PSQ1_BRAPC|nr:hypothetical protein BpHYR1_026343 [Brachionus plicatilis]